MNEAQMHYAYGKKTDLKGYLMFFHLLDILANTELSGRITDHWLPRDGRWVFCKYKARENDYKYSVWDDNQKAAVTQHCKLPICQ